MRRASLLLFTLALGGCSLLVDGEVGDLEEDPTSQRSVTVSLRAFEPHVDQLVDIQVVDPAEGFVIARAILDPLPAADVDVRLLNGAPASVDRIDFYADLNMNRALDPPPEDHVWRCDSTVATPCELDGDRLLFVHNVMFQDIAADPATPTGRDWVLNVDGAEAQDGRPVLARLRTRVAVDAEGEVRVDVVPGLYRLGAVESGTVAFTLPGIADPGQVYDVELLFGDDAEECVLEEQRVPTAPGEAFVVERSLSAFTCAAPEPVDCAMLEEQCERGVEGTCRRLADRCAFVDRSR
jgi:hypothetical protein